MANAFLLSITLLFTSIANAETVSVKYYGSVNLNSFDCVKTISSFVNRICYNESSQTAIVLLRSTYYAYCRIPNTTISEWLRSASKGRYYNSAIKGKYRC